MSLDDSPVAVMLPITDVDRAHQFYADKLGLTPDGTNGDDELMYRLAGGAELVLRVLPDAPRSPNTALSFTVSDIVGEIGDLEGRGVVFEDYDLPGFRTQGHIFESEGLRAAWFLDPDGNLLCLHQLTD